MQFVAPAEHYDRFMGRYAPTLAVELADAADLPADEIVPVADTVIVRPDPVAVG